MEDSSDYIAKLMDQMCQQIQTHNDAVEGRYPLAIVNNDVLAIMQHVPRHMFLPQENFELAYIDSAIPIEHGQTISQPYIVALMTSLLAPKITDQVLEIGTGSGYQAAVLAALVAHVCTIEFIPELSKQANQRFKNLNLNNISTKIGNGAPGWPEYAPFDSIIVTAAAHEIPSALLDQLKPGGRLVIPLEDNYGEQELYLIQKEPTAEIIKQSVLPVKFVKLQ